MYADQNIEIEMSCQQLGLTTQFPSHMYHRGVDESGESSFTCQPK